MLQPIKSIEENTTGSNLEDINKLQADFNSTLIQSPQDQEGKTYAILDNTTLINKFVQGETQLLANQSLRIDSSFERIELTTRKGIIIGLYTLNSQPISVLIRSGSEYNELLYESLLKNNFILIGKSYQKGFVEYHQYIPPVGYKVNCTQTVVLWRNWWMGERNAHKHHIQMDILISLKNKWYPISEITSNQGIFYIKTLAGELSLHSGEKIIWVSKLGEDSPQQGEQNIVQDSSNLGTDANSSDKFNTQQAAFTKIQNSNQQTNYLQEEHNSDLEKNNFNPKISQQSVASTDYTSSINSNQPSTSLSHQPNLETTTFAQSKNIAIPNSSNQEKEQNAPTLAHAQLKNSLQSLKLKAIQTLENYLVNGATETITENLRNAHGQVVQTQSISIKKQCPTWVIESILEKNDLLENSKSKKSPESSESSYLDFPL